MIKKDSAQYDKKEFFKALKDIEKYQVGNVYFCISDNKIFECVVCKVTLNYYNNYLTHNSSNQLFLQLVISVLLDGSSTNMREIKPENLFNSREEAAEQFLKDNDVPAELLKVLKQYKPKTTVADLIEKLQNVDPNIDLASVHGLVLKRISNIYLRGNTTEETTDKYWD